MFVHSFYLHKDTVQNFLHLILHQQTMDENRNRFEGNSGFLEVRSDGTGAQPYQQPLYALVLIGSIRELTCRLIAHTGTPLSMADRPTYKDRLEVGEFGCQLNGVAFWSRYGSFASNLFL
jgi:hypothetical protein